MHGFTRYHMESEWALELKASAHVQDNTTYDMLQLYLQLNKVFCVCVFDSYNTG
jgi:hypothetical protein